MVSTYIVELGLLREEDPSYRELAFFIRDLRTDARILPGFIEQITTISDETQIKYMSKYKTSYFVCFHGELPVGFGGVVDNDIRFAVVPYYHGKGFGSKILEYIKATCPNATGKIKSWNTPSIELFKKHNIPFKLI